jgi:hypothetical protein
MKTILTSLSLLALTGCASTMAVPVVKEAPICSVSDAMLAACGEPGLIKQGITFGEMINVSAHDRDTLRDCAHTHKNLAEAITDCNDKLEKYNAEIRELNARNAAKQ